MAGYSGTPLAQKLGLRPGSSFLTVAAPPEFSAALGEMPEGVERTDVASVPAAPGKVRHDVAIVFVTRRADVAPTFARVSSRMAAAGGVWLAWPKKSSKVPTDVTEDVLRELVLPTGWVDNKVCAVDERWSGLRFVLRKENRPRETSAPTSGSKPRRIEGTPARTPSRRSARPPGHGTRTASDRRTGTPRIPR